MGPRIVESLGGRGSVRFVVPVCLLEDEDTWNNAFDTFVGAIDYLLYKANPDTPMIIHTYHFNDDNGNIDVTLWPTDGHYPSKLDMPVDDGGCSLFRQVVIDYLPNWGRPFDFKGGD